VARIETMLIELLDLMGDRPAPAATLNASTGSSVKRINIARFEPVGVDNRRLPLVVTDRVGIRHYRRATGSRQATAN
jgi:hypothetical protein